MHPAQSRRERHARAEAAGETVYVRRHGRIVGHVAPNPTVEGRWIGQRHVGALSEGSNVGELYRSILDAELAIIARVKEAEAH